jgi:hypothetical protein
MKNSEGFRVGLLSLLCLLSAVIAAADEESSMKVTVPVFRYRLDHVIESDLYRGLLSEFEGETWEYLRGELELGISFDLSRYVNAYIELRLDNNYMGENNPPQPGGYNDVLRHYWVRWSPAAFSDQALMLKVGDFGTGFGRFVNNNDSPRGSIEVSWIMRDMAFNLGYGRTFEGSQFNSAHGDGHLIRGQWRWPASSGNFSIGTYGAVYIDRDVLVQDADYGISLDQEPTLIPELLSNGTVFVGAVECSGGIRNIEVYTEFGMTSGSADLASSDDLNIAYGAGGNVFLYNTALSEVKLSGAYALGGLTVDFDSFAFAVEAGFGNGDGLYTDTADGEIRGYLGPHNSFSIDDIIEDKLLLLHNGAAGLAGLTYLKMTVDVKPMPRWTVAGAVVYEKPTKPFMSPITGQRVESFGFEFHARSTYQFTKHLDYAVMAALALIDESWFEDNQFRLRNSLEFKY